MKNKFLAALSLAASLIFVSPVVASAATVLLNSVHDYGNGAGKINPGGNDDLGTDYVRVSDSSSSRFNDAFDISGIAGTVESIELTLTFDKSGPSLFPGELWLVRAQGSNSSSDLDDIFIPLVDAFSPETIVYTLALDALLGSDVFAHSVLTGVFEFWFSEETGAFLGGDKFDLDSAQLKVYGVAAVPVPAALPLLGTGLALMSFVGWRRKRKAK